MKTKFKNKYLLGYVDKKPIYLSAPSWDCGWYWSLGNENCHYHLNGLDKRVDTCTAIKNHFGDTLRIRRSHIWTFAELIETAYLLKSTAETLRSGGAHLSTNPCAEIIKNVDEVTRINEVVLPAIFDALDDILFKDVNLNKILKGLVEIDLVGDTEISYQYMVENGLKPEDIKGKEGISTSDYTRLQSKYYKELHKRNKHEEKN